MFNSIKLLFYSIVLFNIQIIYCFEYFSPDPDIGRNTSQIIESRGFIPETHHIITSDGYILTVFRIVNPQINRSRNGYPVYIQHGFFQNSDNWLITSPGFLGMDGIYREDNLIENKCSPNGSVARTLPFVLASCGYDVWLGNIRGNRYSSHLYLDQNSDLNYWNFSIDSFTKYDITAAIDHVLRVTERESMGYIGYSLGTTIMFQLLSTKPNYSAIIKPFINLGPFVYIGHVLSPILRIATVFEPVLKTLSIPLARIGPEGNLSPNIGRWFCGYSMFKEFCVVFGFLFGGFDYPQLNRTQIPRLFAHFPDSSSSIALSHIGQRIMNKNFSFYSSSPEINRQVYGQEMAPNYDISRIDSQNIFIFSGLNDWIADTTDVDILINQLRVNVTRYVIPYNLWTHLDFILANDVGKYINSPILDILRQYSH